MSDAFDLLLTGGTVLNPATKLNQKLDVAVTGDRVAAIQADLPRSGAKRVIDVAGCYVTPGLIDFHVHSYWGVNPYGCNLDSLCLATGVTTTMDAGSAGPVNFLGFRKLVYDQSKTRMLGFIALAQHGVLNTPGELLNLGFADSDGAAETVGNNRDIGIGIKVRLHKKSIGENSREALRLAIKAGEATRTPIMVHVGDTAIGMDEIADTLRPGDIITHCYTPQKPSIIDDKGKLLPLVRKAKERGVIFDVGHAGGHFDFNLVARAMGEGIIARRDQLGLARPLGAARFRRRRRLADGAHEILADGSESSNRSSPTARSTPRAWSVGKIASAAWKSDVKRTSPCCKFSTIR